MEIEVTENKGKDSAYVDQKKVRTTRTAAIVTFFLCNSHHCRQRGFFLFCLLTSLLNRSRMSASLSSKQSRNEKSNVASPNSADPHRLPPPPFTIKELRDAIPPHCFERSLLKSSAYMVADLVGVATLFSIAYYYNEMSGDSTLWKISNFIFWPMYWFAQGAVMTGLWVIAHECGHQVFFWNCKTSHVISCFSTLSFGRFQLFLLGILQMENRKWFCWMGTSQPSSCSLSQLENYSWTTSQSNCPHGKGSSKRY